MTICFTFYCAYQLLVFGTQKLVSRSNFMHVFVISCEFAYSQLTFFYFTVTT